jgi:hypothetical protein
MPEVVEGNGLHKVKLVYKSVAMSASSFAISFGQDRFHTEDNRKDFHRLL